MREHASNALTCEGCLVPVDPNKDVCAAPYWDDAAPYATETYLPTFYNRTAAFTVGRSVGGVQYGRPLTRETCHQPVYGSAS